MNDELRKDLGAIITTGFNVIAGISSIQPEIQQAITVCSPILSRAVEKALSIVGSRGLSVFEKNRLGVTFIEAAKTVEQNEKAGRQIKQDIFDELKGDELVEKVFRCVAEDAQEEKDAAYGRMIGNFPYQDEFDAGILFTLASTLGQLSYDELLLLSIINEMPATDFEPVYKKFLNSGDSVAGELTHHFLHFRELALTVRPLPFATNHTLGNTKISSLGSALCRFAGLDKLETESRSYLKNLLRCHILGEDLSQ